MSFIPHEMHNRLLCMCGDNYMKDDGWRFLHEIRCNYSTFNIILEAQEKVLKEIDKQVGQWVSGLSIK